MACIKDMRHALLVSTEDFYAPNRELNDMCADFTRVMVAESGPVELPGKINIVTSKDIWARIKGVYGNDRDVVGMFQKVKGADGKPCVVVLVPLNSSDKKHQRAVGWHRYFLKILRRVSRHDTETASPWPKLVTGEGADVIEALEWILANPQPIGTDVETVGEYPDIKITAIGLGTRSISVSVPWSPYVSKAFGLQEGLRASRVRELVEAILASPLHAKVYHNGMFDLPVFRAVGLDIQGAYVDTILKMKIVYPELNKNLQIGAALAGIDDPWKSSFREKREKLLKDTKIKSVNKLLKDWAEIPLSALLVYNAKDSAATIILNDHLDTALKSIDADGSKQLLMHDLAAYAANQREYGIEIDLTRRDELWKEGRSRLAKLIWKWRKLVGPNCPAYGPGSAESLKELFFKRLGAPVMARTLKFTPSINSFSLLAWDSQKHQPLADIAFTLYEIRKIQKNLAAFLGPLTSPVLHATPNIAGTLGTRKSYQKPNLQQWAKAQTITRFSTGENIDLAPNVRQLVKARKDHVIVEADYSSLELLAVRYRTGNKLWKKWSDEGCDMHIQHVGLMWGVWIHRKGCTENGCDGGEHYCSATKGKWNDKAAKRQIAKVSIYARFYNEAGNAEAPYRMLVPKMPSLTLEFMSDVFHRMDAAIPDIPLWHANARRLCQARGYAKTGIGNWILPIDPRRPDMNRALSFEIQSTVGHVANVAERLFYQHEKTRLGGLQTWRLLFTVHDSFVVECPKEDIHECAAWIKACMEWEIPELWGNQKVKLPVDIQVGPTWAKLSAYEAPKT